MKVDQWAHKLSSVGGTEAQLLVIRHLCAGDEELITKLSIGKGEERFSTMHVPAANKYWRGDQLRLNPGDVEVSLHHVSLLPRFARRASQLSFFQLNFSLTRATVLSCYEVGSLLAVGFLTAESATCIPRPCSRETRPRSTKRSKRSCKTRLGCSQQGGTVEPRRTRATDNYST